MASPKQLTEEDMQHAFDDILMVSGVGLVENDDPRCLAVPLGSRVVREIRLARRQARDEVLSWGLPPPTPNGDIFVEPLFLIAIIPRFMRLHDALVQRTMILYAHGLATRQNHILSFIHEVLAGSASLPDSPAETVTAAVVRTGNVTLASLFYGARELFAAGELRNHVLGLLTYLVMATEEQLKVRMAVRLEATSEAALILSCHYRGRLQTDEGTQALYRALSERDMRHAATPLETLRRQRLLLSQGFTLSTPRQAGGHLEWVPLEAFIAELHILEGLARPTPVARGTLFHDVLDLTLSRRCFTTLVYEARFLLESRSTPEHTSSTAPRRRRRGLALPEMRVSTTEEQQRLVCINDAYLLHDTVYHASGGRHGSATGQLLNTLYAIKREQCDTLPITTSPETQLVSLAPHVVPQDLERKTARLNSLMERLRM